jgi:pyridoxamine 5'-phosphate oxidase
LKLYHERDEYKNESLLSTSEDPFEVFQKWYSEAQNSEPHSANAMTLCTVDEMGAPSCRAVLLKALESQNFVFFTNTNSPKAQNIAHNPRVCLHFYWKSLHRQVKVMGIATQVTRTEAVAYFLSRPIESQISSWVSDQSKPISSRQKLIEKLSEFKNKLPSPMTAPLHWGGYKVTANIIEFWQGAEHRLHHRVLYKRNASSEPFEASILNP